MSKDIVNQRFINCINFLIESKKVPSKSFLAKTFNISNPKFSEILNNRMNVGVDILMILVSEFNISSEWLLTGQGEMLKNIPAPEPAPQESHAGADELVTLLRDKIALLEKNNTLLEKNNALLEDKIEDLKRRLEFAEVKDKEEMSLKIKKQRKENKTIIAEKNEIIFAQSEEINTLKSRHLPPDKPLRPAQKL